MWNETIIWLPHWGTVWILANITRHPLPFHHSPSNRIIPNATLYCSREQTLLLLNSGRGLPWSDNLILQISYDELMHFVDHCGANFLSYNRINFATPLNFFRALSNSVLINLKKMSMEVGFCCSISFLACVIDNLLFLAQMGCPASMFM